MMDKEEFINYVEKINERIREKLKDDGNALEFYSRLVVGFNRICDESQKQKEVIDKATNWTIKYQTEWCQEDEVIRDLKQLLDILKGEQNG